MRPNVLATYLAGTYTLEALSANCTSLGAIGTVSLLPLTLASYEFSVSNKVFLSLFNSKVLFFLLNLYLSPISESENISFTLAKEIPSTIIPGYLDLILFPFIVYFTKASE